MINEDDTVVGTQFAEEQPEQMFEDVSDEELAKEAAEDTVPVALPEPVAEPPRRKRGRPRKAQPADTDTKKVVEIEVGDTPKEEVAEAIEEVLKGVDDFMVVVDQATVPLRNPPEPVVDEDAARRVREAEEATARIINWRRRGRR